ncbi:MAG: type II toxin-antitoxin system VapC family toxin [Candidatus Poribacteria bacterium]|nr:type II toxin-antitoxin system VapC family toxin [Candidatus Poribacteria bacterium]
MNPTTPPALLDTAIPMYAAGTSHSYRAPCQWVMTEIANGQMTAAIDAEVIQEILHRYGSLGRHADAVSLANNLMILVPQIYPITAADVQIAVSLFHQYAPQGVKSRDIVHAAVMQNNGLTHIISTDVHFDRIAGITRLDPLTLYQQAQKPSP